MGYEPPRRVNITLESDTYTGAVSPAKEVVAAGTKNIPGNSGGIELSSGEVVSITVKALSNNSGDIYGGGPTVAPYSGAGFLLRPGEAWNLDVDNLNDVRFFATHSGDMVSYTALK